MELLTKLNIRNKGITLFELIVVIIIIAILAAMVLPLFPNMTDSSKQSNTVANLRSIASAMSMYRIDHDAYPEVSNINALRTILEPKYMTSMPTKDGWGKEFFIESNSYTYTIGSGGKGWNGTTALTVTPIGPTDSIDSDIIVIDGEFRQYPANHK